jgi:hypothetical protein
MKEQGRYNIKVGMASNHPVQRVHDQISASKTAIAERAIILLVFQTHDCRHLEQWLHRQLERNTHSVGREWFTTKPEELIALFQAYLDGHFVPSQEVAEIDEVVFQ